MNLISGWMNLSLVPFFFKSPIIFSTTLPWFQMLFTLEAVFESIICDFIFICSATRLPVPLTIKDDTMIWDPSYIGQFQFLLVMIFFKIKFILFKDGVLNLEWHWNFDLADFLMIKSFSLKFGRGSLVKLVLPLPFSDFWLCFRTHLWISRFFNYTIFSFCGSFYCCYYLESIQ